MASKKATAMARDRFFPKTRVFPQNKKAADTDKSKWICPKNRTAEGKTRSRGNIIYIIL